MTNILISPNRGKLMSDTIPYTTEQMTTVLLDRNGGFTSYPELLTEEELVVFLRIPLISNAENYANVIENLKRMHNLPCIHICKKPLYPLEAIRRWIEEKLLKEQR